MKQFHVFRTTGGSLVLNLQSEHTETGLTVCAPLLLHDGRSRITVLEPEFVIEGQTYTLRTGEMAALPQRVVRPTPVADLSAHDYEIRRAIDLVFSGF